MLSEAPWLDWELAESSYTCTIIEGDLPVGAKFILERDRDFALLARVQATSLTIEAATAVPHVIHATGRTESGAQVEIVNAFIRNRSAKNDGAFTFQLEAQEVSLKCSTALPARLVEWLANFGSELMFTRDTETSAAISVSRKRTSETWSSALELDASSQWTSDHLVICCTVNGRSVSFLLGRTAAPSMRAVRPGFIEYLDQGSGLPTEDERDLIRAGLSFIFDHQFVLLSDTVFDSSHKVISAQSISGKYLGARYLLHNQAEVPAPLYDESRPHLLCEKRTSDLLQQFLNHCTRLRLDRVVQKMWDAKTSTLDSRIARLVATIELLRDAHLGEGESLLPRKQWSQLCSAMKAAMITKANELGITNERALVHLANKLPNINFASSTKQFDRFFEALRLTISEAEQKAMDMRNDQAHGVIYEREHYKDLVMNVRRVQVLLNRVMLSLIGHEDYYNDHTQSQIIERPLAEPSECKSP